MGINKYLFFILLILSMPVFSEDYINIGAGFGKSYELNTGNYKKGAGVLETGYSDFMRCVYDFDNSKQILNKTLSLSDGKLEMVLGIEAYSGFGYHINEQKYTIPALDFKNIDQNFPYKGYLQYEFIKFGRDKLSWGPGKYGNLILSDASKYFDHLGIELKTDNVKYNYVIAMLDPYLTTNEEKIIDSVSLDVNAGGKVFDDRVKFFIGHRLEWMPVKSVKLGFTEGEMVGGQFPDFRHISPLNFYHSTFTEGYSNVISGIDVEYKADSGRIYGSLAIDDWSVGDEVGFTYKPDAAAWLAGGDIKVNDSLKIDGEYARTSRWIYNRWQEYLKFTNRRIIVSTYGDSGRYVVDYPIGYFMGPDCEAFIIQADYNALKLMYKNIKKGEINLRTDYDDAKKSLEWLALSGKVEEINEISLSGTIGSFLISASYELIKNYQNKDGLNKNNLSGYILYKIKI